MIPQILQGCTLKTLVLLVFPFSTVRHFSFSSLPQAWAEGTAANMQGEYCDMHHKIVPR